MSAHTPGPWLAENEHVAGRQRIFIKATSGPRAIRWDVARVEVPLTDALHGGLTRDEVELANARLISAAPELLAALKDLIDAQGFDHDDDCPGDDTCPCLLAKRINDAIAKAEGAR